MGVCEYADGTTIPFPNRRLNTFLNQAPILDENGCVEFVAPDIVFNGIISVSNAKCPHSEITVAFEIGNSGEIDISGNLPISFYDGDPRIAGAVHLGTQTERLVNFEIGSLLEITKTFTGPGGNFDLYVVINDNGSTPPLTNPLPTATIPECDTENNLDSARIGFQPFALTLQKINDNRRCDHSLPNNGSARAFYQDGGVERTEADGYTFRWYNQNDFSSVLYTGSTYTGMATGTYDVPWLLFPHGLLLRHT